MNTYIYSLFPYKVRCRFNISKSVYKNIEKVLPLGNAPSRSEDDRFTVYPTSLVVYERIQKRVCSIHHTLQIFKK
nr:MAG TPA: hypothetical protein [Bacteriophage sp.]